MGNKTCPICGAETLSLKQEFQILKEAYGGQKEIDIKNYYCSTCESDGDFFNENELTISQNIDLLKRKSITNILNDFNENKISMAAIERALSLPQRTLARWKNENTTPSATGLALMKFIRTFPWLLDVAENNFDYNGAQKIFISSAIEKFLQHLNFDDKEFSEAGIVATSKSTFLYMNFENNDIEKTDSINDSQMGFNVLNENSQFKIAQA